MSSKQVNSPEQKQSLRKSNDEYYFDFSHKTEPKTETQNERQHTAKTKSSELLKDGELGRRGTAEYKRKVVCV